PSGSSSNSFDPFRSRIHESNRNANASGQSDNASHLTDRLSRLSVEDGRLDDVNRTNLEFAVRMLQRNQMNELNRNANVPGQPDDVSHLTDHLSRLSVEDGQLDGVSRTNLEFSLYE